MFNYDANLLRKGNIGVWDEMKILNKHTHTPPLLETYTFIYCFCWLKMSSILEFHILIKFDDTLMDLLPKKTKDVLCFTWTWEFIDYNWNIHYKKTIDLQGKFARKNFPCKFARDLQRNCKEIYNPRKFVANLRGKKFPRKFARNSREKIQFPRNSNANLREN